MARRDLLPGTTAEIPAPPVVFDSRSAVKRARRRAAIRDAAQLMILAGVDWLFVRWPYAHVPGLDRWHSVLVVAVLNAAVLTHVIVSRTFPRWTARRIAASWCLAERARFFSASRRELPR